MVWQVMVDTHEEFVEFGRYLRHGDQYDDEHPVVLARDSLPRDGLDEFVEAGGERGGRRGEGPVMLIVVGSCF